VGERLTANILCLHRATAQVGSKATLLVGACRALTASESQQAGDDSSRNDPTTGLHPIIAIQEGRRRVSETGVRLGIWTFHVLPVGYQTRVSELPWQGRLAVSGVFQGSLVRQWAPGREDKEEVAMYIGVGAIVLILLVVLVLMMMRRSSV